MKAETKFYKNKIYPHLRKWKNCKYDRIENSVGEGFPDLVMSVNAKTFFYELKIARGKNGLMKIEPTQINWHLDALEAGCSAYFLVWYELKKEMYRFKATSLSKIHRLSSINDKELILDIMYLGI